MREQEAKLANVKKSCEVARKVTKVFSILMIIATVLCLIGGITVFAARNYINDNVVIEDYNSETYDDYSNVNLSFPVYSCYKRSVDYLKSKGVNLDDEKYYQRHYKSRRHSF